MTRHRKSKDIGFAVRYLNRFTCEYQSGAKDTRKRELYLGKVSTGQVSQEHTYTNTPV